MPKKRVGDAKVYLVSYNVICPHCGEPAKARNGSINLLDIPLPTYIECRECGRTSRVGKKINLC